MKIRNTLKGQTVIEGLPDKNLPSTMPKENFDAFPCTIWEGEMQNSAIESLSDIAF